MRKIRVIIIGIVIVVIAVSGLVIWRVSRNKLVEKPILSHETKNPTKNTNVEIKKTSKSGEPWPEPIGLAEGKKYIGKEIIHAKWGKGPGEFGLPEHIYKGWGEYIDGPGWLAIRDSTVYLFDLYNHRILKYNLDGHYTGAFDLEKGINIPPSLKNTDYPGICTIFEKDKKVEFKPKMPFLDKIYQSFPPNKCIFLGASPQIAVDKEKNIFLTAKNYVTSDRIILKYSKDGKLLSKIFDTGELSNTDKKMFRHPLYGLMVDDSDNLYLYHASCNGVTKEEILNNCHGTVVRISGSNYNKVKIFQWAELDDKTKAFLGPIFIPDPASSVLDTKLKKLIECSRGLAAPFAISVGKVRPKIAMGNDGNIYEVVICPTDFYKWKEDIRVYEWRLIKWSLVK